MGHLDAMRPEVVFQQYEESLIIVDDENSVVHEVTRNLAHQDYFCTDWADFAHTSAMWHSSRAGQQPPAKWRAAPAATMMSPSMMSPNPG